MSSYSICCELFIQVTFLCLLIWAAEPVKGLEPSDAQAEARRPDAQTDAQTQPEYYSESFYEVDMEAVIVYTDCTSWQNCSKLCEDTDGCVAWNLWGDSICLALANTGDGMVTGLKGDYCGLKPVKVVKALKMSAMPMQPKYNSKSYYNVDLESVLQYSDCTSWEDCAHTCTDTDGCVAWNLMTDTVCLALANTGEGMVDGVEGDYCGLLAVEEMQLTAVRPNYNSNSYYNIEFEAVLLYTDCETPNCTSWQDCAHTCKDTEGCVAWNLWSDQICLALANTGEGIVDGVEGDYCGLM